MDTPFLPKYNFNDIAYDAIYPDWVRLLSKRHWTPVEIAKKAAEFLAQRPRAKILDIGSGSGKFCIIGASIHKNVTFYGVEQRLALHREAEWAKEKMGLVNVEFIHGNLTSIDLDMFDGFYFYNSFYENLETRERISEDLEYSRNLYEYYSFYLRGELDKKPKGTRLVTYYSDCKEVPMSFRMVDCYFHPELNMWRKD